MFLISNVILEKLHLNYLQRTKKIIQLVFILSHNVKQNGNINF